MNVNETLVKGIIAKAKAAANNTVTDFKTATHCESIVSDDKLNSLCITLIKSNDINARCNSIFSIISLLVSKYNTRISDAFALLYTKNVVFSDVLVSNNISIDDWALNKIQELIRTTTKCNKNDVSIILVTEFFNKLLKENKNLDINQYNSAVLKLLDDDVLSNKIANLICACADKSKKSAEELINALKSTLGLNINMVILGIYDEQLTNMESTAANNIGYNPMTFNIGNFVDPVSIDTGSKPVTFVPPVVPHLQTAPAPTAQDLLKIKLDHLKQHIKFIENGKHKFTIQDLDSLDAFIHSINLKMILDKHKIKLPLMLFEIEVTPEKAKEGYDLCFRINCADNKYLKVFYGTKQMQGPSGVFNPVVINICDN